MIRLIKQEPNERVLSQDCKTQLQCGEHTNVPSGRSYSITYYEPPSNVTSATHPDVKVFLAHSVVLIPGAFTACMKITATVLEHWRVSYFHIICALTIRGNSLRQHKETNFSLSSARHDIITLLPVEGCVKVY